MGIEVGIDATGDPGRELLRWSWPSLSSLTVGGMARPSSDRSDGRFGLLVATRTNHPPRRRDVPLFVVRLEELGRRRPKTPHAHKSGRISQCSRSYLGPAVKDRGHSRRLGGHPLPCIGHVTVTESCVFEVRHPPGGR